MYTQIAQPLSYIPSRPLVIQWMKSPITGSELAGAEAAPSLPTDGRGAHRWEEEVPQQRVQPLSLPDAPLGHPPRFPQNHPNPGASPGPGASCPRNEAREPQGTSARSKPAAAVLRPGPPGSSVAGNSPRGGAPPATRRSQVSRLGAPQGGSGRKGRRAAGAAQTGTAPPASRRTRPHHVLIGH